MELIESSFQVLESTTRDQPVVPLPSTENRLQQFSPVELKESHSRTSIDITSRRPIRLVITPVSVQVGADVLENMPVVSILLIFFQSRTNLKLDDF